MSGANDIAEGPSAEDPGARAAWLVAEILACRQRVHRAWGVPMSAVEDAKRRHDRLYSELRRHGKIRDRDHEESLDAWTEARIAAGGAP